MANDRAAKSQTPDSRTAQQRIYAAIEWGLKYLSWVPPVVSGLATLGSAVLFLFVPKPDGSIRVDALVWGCILAAASVVLTIMIDQWRRQSKAGQTAERIQLQLTMNDAIAPIVREMQKMSVQDSAARLRTLERIIGHVGQAVPMLLPETRRIRVVVYRLEQSRGARRRRLVVANATGRKDSPKPFIDGDSRGSAVFEWLARGESMFVADIRETRLPGWEGSGKGYKTFISTPLIANESVYGMLAIDAPVPGDLDEADRPIAEVLAALLSAAYAQAQRA